MKKIKEIKNKTLLTCPLCSTHPLYENIGTLLRIRSESVYKMKNEYKKPLAVSDAIKYLLIGPQRSGSTVIFQILNELEYDRTLKIHNLINVENSSDCPVMTHYNDIILTIRNPYDIIISLLTYNDIDIEDWNIENFIKLNLDKGVIKNSFNTSVRVIKYYQAIRLIYDSIGMASRLPNILIIKYEDQGDSKSRVEALIKYLNLNISDEEKEKISKKFSIKSNMKRIKQFSIDNKTENYFLRKNHISNTMGVTRKHLLSQSLKDAIYETYFEYFYYFNYER